MAISHLQSLFVLLASLFFIPAFCALDFEYCNQSGYDWGNITRVEYDRLSAIPTETGDEGAIKITIYGSTNINASKYIDKVHNEYVEVNLNEYGHIHFVDYYDLCDLTACPIKPGTNFVLTFSKVEYYPIYSDHGKYQVKMFDDKQTVFMCVSIEVPNLALTLV